MFLPSSVRTLSGPYLGLLMLIVSITSTQAGTAAAKFLVVQVGPEVTVALRLACATILLFIAVRPWRHVPSGREWKSVLIYGVAIAFMNGCFYQALARIPQGMAVAVEFSGPLMVAVCSSRRWTDVAGIVFAVAGLLLILPLSKAQLETGLDITGLGFAFAAAAGWAAYIVFGRRAGGGGVSVAAWGMLAGTIVAVPWAVAAEGTLLFRPDVLADVLPMAFLVGFLASALPYGLEIVALRIVPPQAYGVLMSLEPAAAAMFGFLILGEMLSLRQWSALGLIICASLLVTRSFKKS